MIDSKFAHDSFKEQLEVSTMKIKGIYDNGEDLLDRYTIVVYPSKAKVWDCLCTGERPEVYSQWATCQVGKHLGKKLSFEQLPEHVQKHVQARLAA